LVSGDNVTPSLRLRNGNFALPSLALGTWAAGIAAAPDPSIKTALAAPAPLLAGAWWLLRKPARWLQALFFCLILLPPLGMSSSNWHVAPAIFAVGLLAGLLRKNEWSRVDRSVAPLLLLFTGVLFASIPLAALYSGPNVASGSLARVLLFSIAVYVFLYTSSGPAPVVQDPISSLRWLYGFAMVGAAFALVDFYYQLPAPAGFAPQYVWLDLGVFRRAQGLFYEASTLGNFCAFFLVMILVAAFDRSRRCFSWPVLASGFVVFTGALIFSYSRASAVNVAVATIAFLFVRRAPAPKLVIGISLLGLLTFFTLRTAAPEFFNHYFTRIAVSFEFMSESPNRVLSGRLASWQFISEFVEQHPLDVILGIGYKTLPYSSYAGQPVVADNTYLSLLVETGIVGLVAFLLLNVAILRSAWRAARSANPNASFFGTWVYCFWCGEMVQMMSGDLITYWRVLPLYFWALAVTTREQAA
jgi:O-antigen ligase